MISQLCVQWRQLLYQNDKPSYIYNHMWLYYLVYHKDLTEVKFWDKSYKPSGGKVKLRPATNQSETAKPRQKGGGAPDQSTKSRGGRAASRASRPEGGSLPPSRPEGPGKRVGHHGPWKTPGDSDGEGAARRVLFSVPLVHIPFVFFIVLSYIREFYSKDAYTCLLEFWWRVDPSP